MEEPNPYESPRVTNVASEDPSEADQPQVAAASDLKTLEPLGVIAFVLALLMLPTLTDLLALAGAMGMLLPVVALNVVGSVVVLVPTIRSWRRHLKAPGQWRGFGYCVGATIILGLHAALVIVGLLAIALG